MRWPALEAPIGPAEAGSLASHHQHRLKPEAISTLNRWVGKDNLPIRSNLELPNDNPGTLRGKVLAHERSW